MRGDITFVFCISGVHFIWSLLIFQDLGKKNGCSRSRVCSDRQALCWAVKRQDSDPAWYTPSSLAELNALLTSKSGARYRLVAGDTGKGG